MVLICRSGFILAFARAALAETRDLPAAERRQLIEHFCATFAWDTLRPHLPLRLALPGGVPNWLPRSTFPGDPPERGVSIGLDSH